MMDESNNNNYFNLEDNLHRISIQVYNSQYSKLKKISRPGLSISSIIRKSIDFYISHLDQKFNSENKNNFEDSSLSKDKNNSYISSNSESYIEAELIKLSSLENKGLISSEEYKILRKKVLGI
ncbi:hypothetical protein [Prochlorococcus marinus]|uniref:hypothetical protein n=2 Tax=Prochlorococcus marinus TaxID=1219 RepID=UPI001C5A3EE1|nr:hypothetical protein [Prochlorococcus marinus]